MSDTEKHAGSESQMDDGKTSEVLQKEHADTGLSSHSDEVGVLYRDDHMVLLPAPTKDPKDPLNLPLMRKVVCMGFLCMFGAMSAGAELILGAMLPVFVLQYADIDPKILQPLTDDNGGLPEGVNPLTYLANLPNEPVLWHVYLLASLPIAVIGLSNLFFIPLAVAVGRRTIIILSGFVAIAGAVWAGYSTNLWTHIGARCIQAVGAGTVESLIPFIITDISHIHERNRYLAASFSAQGLALIILGIASPYIIINLSWRWIYWITASMAGFFLCGIILFLPETRWERTADEINGIPRVETQTEFEPRSWKYDLRLFQGKAEFRRGLNAFVNSLRTFFYPHIFCITVLDSAMIGAALAAAYTAAPCLITKPWSWHFLNLGLCLISVLIGAIFVYLLGGIFADSFANWIARKRGRRLPENQLLNLILPCIFSILGSVLFGLCGDNQVKYSQWLFLASLAFMTYGFLSANAVGAVYVLECFPDMAGPALVNIASFRAIIAFALSFKVSEWMVDFGYLNTMLIYTGIIAVFSLTIPIIYVWGPAWRKRFATIPYL